MEYIITLIALAVLGVYIVKSFKKISDRIKRIEEENAQVHIRDDFDNIPVTNTGHNSCQYTCETKCIGCPFKSCSAEPGEGCRPYEITQEDEDKLIAKLCGYDDQLY